MPRSRRRMMASLAALTLLLAARGVDADDVAVPVSVQAELMAKVAAYDGNLPARAGERVKVLIVTRAGNADSARAAGQMAAELGHIDAIAGLPHEETTATFGDAAGLARACKDGRVAIVYLTPGFPDADVDAVVKALDGVDVLSVSAVPPYVPRGIVLGFDLVSGKPKLLVHLTQARKQHVALRAEVLQLMKVYE